MTRVNENFLKLQKNYLFSDIAVKVADFKKTHPESNIIRLGIGDVTLPLAPAVLKAMHKAVDEMGVGETFRGYGPEHGYDFLQDAILKNVFEPRGIALERDDVFISDGAKSDTGNIVDILANANSVAVTDPVYPVYVDSNVMCGRAGDFADGRWTNIEFLPCNAENGFTAPLPGKHADIVYLCYPNNPTGTVITRERLGEWVDYALQEGSIIMYDAAYEAYIRDESVPRSIYEIKGAERCAIEFHSYSKTAGFTGVRCGFTVVPRALEARTADGRQVCLNDLWNRRQSTKYNGTSYITQRGAEAVYSEEGKAETRQMIDYYMGNAELMCRALRAAGLQVWGGEHAPYIWFKTPKGMSSWQFFDALLNEVGVVCTPGVGFGPSGEGYIRLTAFGTRENSQEAMRRISRWL